MKLVIAINQQAAVAMGDLDLVDCAILDWLLYICNTKHSRVASERIAGMTWVSYTKLSLDLPLLGISDKGGISRRLKRLRDKGYINIKAIKGRSYVDTTLKCERLLVDNLWETSLKSVNNCD